MAHVATVPARRTPQLDAAVSRARAHRIERTFNHPYLNATLRTPAPAGSHRRERSASCPFFFIFLLPPISLLATSPLSVPHVVEYAPQSVVCYKRHVRLPSTLYEQLRAERQARCRIDRVRHSYSLILLISVLGVP